MLTSNYDGTIMKVLHAIYSATSALLELPFAYAAYSVLTGQTRPESRLADALWFALQFITATIVVDATWEKVGVAQAGWYVFGQQCAYVIVLALLIAFLDRMRRLASGSQRRKLRCFFAAAAVAFLSEMFMANFVIGVDYFDDDGLKIERSQRQARIGLPSGPAVFLSSRLGYYVLRPVRGAVVTIRGESVSHVPPTWQQGTADRFHYKGLPLGSGEYVGRVVGMPGETVSLDQGVVMINGTLLSEPFVQNWITEDDRVVVRLGQGDYLLGEDVRENHSVSANAFYVAKDQQVRSRQLFVVWPLESFGFVRAPFYNIPNPGIWKLQISERWLERLAKM
jgi:Signal peptidase, peptidase S26